MRTPALVLMLLVAAGAAADDREAARLVERLGSPDFATREAASKRLDALGPLALDALRVACLSENPEVANRARDLLRTIERRAASDRALAPTLVTLDATNAPLDEVLATLSKQAGCAVAIGGLNADALAAKKITVMTGKVPFWAAVLKVCDAGGLQIAGVGGFVAPGSMPYRRKPGRPAGAVVLEARAGAKPRPASVHGAVLVEAFEMPQAAASPTVAAAVLQFWPEPKLAWQSVAGVKIATATAADGRKLTPDPTPLALPQVQRLPGKGGVVVVQNADGTITVINPDADYPLEVGPNYTPNVRQALVKLKTGVPVARELRGSAFGLVRSAVEPLATVTLDPLRAATATGPAGVELTASLRTDAAGKRYVSVTLVYEALKVNQAATGNRNQSIQGLSVTDADGAAFELSLTNHRSDFDPTGQFVVAHLTLELCAAKGGPAVPAKVLFHGTYPKRVEVPFALKDVPLAGGKK